MKKPPSLRPARPTIVLASLTGLLSAQTWTLTGAPQATGDATWNWVAVACSADGAKLVAAGWEVRDCSEGWCDYFEGESAIYTSADTGLTWSQTSSPTNVWSAVASSADGAKLVALSPAGIYASANSGAAWSQGSAPANGWSAIAPSADGTKLAAAALGSGLGDGLIYLSANSELNWTPSSAPASSWISVASSADGTRLAAAGGGTDTNSQPITGFIYTSIDSGATWAQTSAPGNSWTSVASSADGTKLAATASSYTHGNGVGIYTSKDAGATWTQNSAFPSSSPFSAVASSADGTTLVLSQKTFGPGNGGPTVSAEVYRSTDSGDTWTQISSPLPGGSPLPCSLACSADGGLTLLAGDGIYSWPYSGPWKLNAGFGAPSSDLTAVACSGDGTKLVATTEEYEDEFGIHPALIYTSADSGATWMQSNASSNSWSAVASSADGVRLAAAASSDLSDRLGTGSIYTSGDSGGTWTRTSAPTAEWDSIASSADGKTLAAITRTSIYISTNSGMTWKQTGVPNDYWTSLSISADGASLAAVSDYSVFTGVGHIYTSTDYGATWVGTNAPGNDWTSVASSADGTKLAAAAGFTGDGLIYTSTDAGATWRPTSAPPHNWESVAASSDGARLIALGSVGEYYGLGFSYISTDSGATWTLLKTPADWEFYGPVACSTDGSSVVAVSANHLYTLHFPPPPPPAPASPKLNIGPGEASCRISWLVPSTLFALQQNADLETTNWTDVPTTPSLNFTNLNYQVTVSPTLSNRFYRLRQQ